MLSVSSSSSSSTTTVGSGITFTNVGKDERSSVDFVLDRDDTKMVSIGTVSCLITPLTIADAIVPVPIKPTVIGVDVVAVTVDSVVVVVAAVVVKEEDSGGSSSVSEASLSADVVVVDVDDDDNVVLVGFNEGVTV